MLMNVPPEDSWLRLKLDTIEKNLGEAKDDIKYIKRFIHEQLPKDISETYVSKTEYAPGKLLLWGMAAVILLTVIGAMVGRVLVK